MLSDYLDNQGGTLSEDEKLFWDSLPPQLVYMDTQAPFEGTPKTVIFSDPIRYFDEQGRELLPLITEIVQPKKDFLKG